MTPLAQGIDPACPALSHPACWLPMGYTLSFCLPPGERGSRGFGCQRSHEVASSEHPTAHDSHFIVNQALPASALKIHGSLVQDNMSAAGLPAFTAPRTMFSSIWTLLSIFAEEVHSC